MEMKVCSVCNHKNRYENRFCTQCGNRLIQKNASSTRLVMLHGDHPNAIYSLNQVQNFIGRDESNTISLNDRQVSKKHAAITNSSGIYWIEDLNSKNGVFINGKKVEKREKLVHGCLVKLGSTILRFEMMPIT